MCSYLFIFVSVEQLEYFRARRFYSSYCRNLLQTFSLTCLSRFLVRPKFFDFGLEGVVVGLLALLLLLGFFLALRGFGLCLIIIVGNLWLFCYFLGLVTTRIGVGLLLVLDRWSCVLFWLCLRCFVYLVVLHLLSEVIRSALK